MSFEDPEVVEAFSNMPIAARKGEDALEIEAQLPRIDTQPGASVYNEGDYGDAELWRCEKCGGSIRNNADIKNGKMCWKCGSTRVIPAWPRWWEKITLFLRHRKIYITVGDDQWKTRKY